MAALLTPFAALDRVTLEQTLDTGARFSTEHQILRVNAFAPGVFRLTYGPEQPTDYGLIVLPSAGITATVDQHDGNWRVQANDVALTVQDKPVRFSLERRGRSLLTSITDQHFRGWSRFPALGIAENGGRVLLSLALSSGERIYGLGEKFGPLDHRGQLIVSRAEDALGVNTELCYKNIPFAWSTGPHNNAGYWGVFVHTTADVTHAVGYAPISHRTYTITVDDPTLDVFFLTGDTPAEIIERFTALTGRPSIPPTWSLGVWLSRAYYKVPEEALQAARQMRDKRFPCDVINFDGRAWQDTPTRFQFVFDPSRFSNPQQTIHDVKALGYKVCAWEYPYVSVSGPLFADLAAKGWLLKDAQGKAYQYRWDPGPFGSVLTPLPTSGLLDFTHVDAYAWWRDQHQALFDMGVDTFKTDFGEQVPRDAVAHNGDDGRRLHNVYPLLYNRCVFEASERYGRGPAVVWGRSGWTGSQRYPVQWGGDPQTDYEGLAASIRGGLSWGLTGVPFYATDVGGFYGASQPDSELYIRWVQAAVYASHFRFHGIGVREPWGFGDEAEGIVRSQLEWRYRLLPYFQDLMTQAHETGAPVMRAMVYAFPNDLEAHAFDLQFMCGPSLLVIPVISPGGFFTGYLPRGRWYDLHTGEVLEGPRVLNAKTPLDRIPVFARDGHVLPLGPVVQHVGEIDVNKPINELWVFGKAAIPDALAQDIKIKTFL